MDIGAVVNQGLIGMQRSQTEMSRSAQQIASVATPQPAGSDQVKDVVEPMLKLKEQAQVFDSSAKVVKAANESIGTLLDIKA
ncbi:MAG TPA: hypothetical protein VN030_13670 [Cellvibrio sp.]|nr:hypothetical protein [Cellvibrio sp.]